MKLAVTIQAMVTAGCTPEQVAAVVAADEAEETTLLEAKLERARERQRRYRQRHAPSRPVTSRNVMSRHVTVTPPKQKEPFPPTPPLLEKLLPPLGLSNDRPVDATVDGSLAIEKAKKNSEPLRAFGEAWNQLAGALKLPAIDEIKTGSTRERQALARLREMPATGIQDLMARIRGSPYLRGEINGFVCSFDWVIKPSNYQKIIEGNYENRKVTAIRR